MDVSRRALARDPTFDEAWNIIGECQLELGNLEEALEIFRRVNNDVLEIHTLGRLGRKEEARRRIRTQIDLIDSGEYIAPIVIAIEFLGLRDMDAVFEWLERAVRARNRNLILLNSNPIWAPIRDDPRYAELVRRIGLDVPGA